MTTTMFVVGYISALVFICMFACLGVGLHIYYTKKDLIIEHMKNSSAVHSPTGAGGLREKLQFVGGVSTALTFSRFYLKHGMISADDLENFPKPLRRKLIVLQWTGMGSLIAMALLLVLSEVIKKYNI